MFSSPRRHLLALYALFSDSFEPLFDEQDLGVVISMFCKHIAAPSVRRDNVEWESKPWTDWSVSYLAVGVRDPLTGSILRRMEWSYVIAITSNLYRLSVYIF
jgi:hypothetical protein